MSYDLKPVKSPRLAGLGLRIFTSLLENRVFSKLLKPMLFKEMGFTLFRSIISDETPTMRPFIVPDTGRMSKSPVKQSELESLMKSTPDNTSGFSFYSINDFARAYREGKADPEAVCDRIIKAIKDSNDRNPPLRAIIKSDEQDIKKQAKLSAERFKNGKPKSIFDGVPVAIKDELDQFPYTTSVGTSFLGDTPVTEDATPVSKLRAAGAILIGKANMHEIGIGITGLNPHHGVVRNPYNPDRFTGGSSSGSGAAVAAGLCPVAIGADGGGSIRIPSSFCGIVGIKATHGRISEHGAAPLCWSVAHVGPIAASARDAALCYALIAGEDSNDPGTIGQPPVHLENIADTNLSNITLGIYEPWFNDASSGVVKACEQTLKSFESQGVQIKKIEIPDLNLFRIAHLITIVSEMATAMDPHYKEHRKDFGLDVRTNLSLGRDFTSRDYIKAQRMRTRAITEFNRVLEQVDAIVTPSTGCTAPIIRKDALPRGESDLETLTEIMRYAGTANFTGLPAISFPAGYDEDGLPVGFQAIGKHWDEHLLLRLAGAAELNVERKKPDIFYDLLA